MSDEDDLDLVSVSGARGMEDPMSELSFLRQGRSAVRGYNLAVEMLVLTEKDTPIAYIADLVEAVEECKSIKESAWVELSGLRAAAEKDPNDGEKLAQLGFVLNTLDEPEEALSVFTRVLEHPDTLSIESHRDCLNNIGWHHFLQGEYEQALGWFEHACRLKEPVHPTGDEDSEDIDEDELDEPYKLALENVLLTLAKMGRLTEATARLEEYHRWFGRLPIYESTALEKLGLQPDVIFIRSRIRNLADEAARS
jgi:tetratricopeptide (TPR) repeat protein